MLLIKSSTGMLGSGGALVGGTGPVTSIPGCCGGTEAVLGAKKPPGIFSVGSA